MRCLSIARACADLQKGVCFLVADTQSKILLQERFAFPSEFEIQCLHSDYQDMEKELPALERAMHLSCSSSEHILPQKKPWILVDSYYVTAPYLEALRKWGHVAYLDDLTLFSYPVDCIINYDIPENEKPDCYSAATRCLLGTAYTPLRSQFQNAPYVVRQDTEHILISTGSIDPFQVAEKLLDRVIVKSHIKAEAELLSDSVLSVPTGYKYHILTSRLNSCYDRLVVLSNKYPNIYIHENVQDMAGLISRCDLAVSAGGTTLYELCAVGVPTISFVMADNQFSAVQTFSASDIIPYAGDVRIDVDRVLDAICTFLDHKQMPYNKRLEFSDKMRSFVDGYGAARIAEALV